VRKVSLFFKCSLLVIVYYHVEERAKRFRKWRKFLKLNFTTALVLMLVYFNLLRNSLSEPESEQRDTNIKSSFLYLWLGFLLVLLLLVPMRLRDVFDAGFLTKMSNITFIRYLCHRYALYIVFEYMPDTHITDFGRFSAGPRIVLLVFVCFLLSSRNTPNENALVYMFSHDECYSRKENIPNYTSVTSI
jgi:peptidoglycan/LPS O-acetylase OafA/YrhL